jgi:hypothetical protein
MLCVVATQFMYPASWHSPISAASYNAYDSTVTLKMKCSFTMVRVLEKQHFYSSFWIDRLLLASHKCWQFHVSD